MNLFNPLGLLFSLFIVGVIILYILKQQHEDIEISSTYLWEKTLHEMEVSKPFQRIKKNILFILQILIILLVSLALARPYIVSGESSSEYIIILDCSASMQAKDVQPNRFEKSKEEISKIINNLLPNEKITLIKADNQASIIANSTDEKALLTNKLRDIDVTNKSDNIQEAISLSNAILKERKDAKVYIYTDKNLNIDNELYNIIVNNKSGENVAVSKMSYTKEDNKITVLSKIHNYGEEKNLNIECLVDGKVRDVQDIHIGKDQIQNVYWDNIINDGSMVKVNITDDDDLDIDNSGYLFINNTIESKVLLISEKNVFMEKAIKLRNNLQLDKSSISELDKINNLPQYDLYIFDGNVPKQLPSESNVIIINPSEDISKEFKISDSFKPNTIEINNNSQYKEIVELINNDSFAVSKAKSILIPDWCETLLKSGDKPLLLCGEKGGQRIIIFTFDLHDSDLPLKSEFPILIQNILSWMLPDVVDNNLNVTSGKEIIINSLPNTQSIIVESPSGNKHNLQVITSTIPFTQTDEVGVYKVNQKIKDNNVIGYFTVGIDENESNISVGQNNVLLKDIDTTKTEDSFLNKNLWYYFAWCALAFILIEWWVYHRGY